MLCSLALSLTLLFASMLINDNNYFFQLWHLETADYDPIIIIFNSWWGGQQMMVPMLPRLFFNHFQALSLAAMSEQKWIGFLVGFQSVSDPSIANIHFDGVDPHHQKMGVAKLLYVEFFDQVRNVGCTKVWCIVSPANQVSWSFHSSMDFIKMAILTNYDGLDEDQVLLEKSLEQISEVMWLLYTGL